MSLQLPPGLGSLPLRLCKTSACKRSGCLQEGAKGAKELPECVLEVPSLHEVELNYGSQDLPDFSRPGSAAGEPIMKERALLQVGTQAPDLPLFNSLPAGCSSCQETPQQAKAVQSPSTQLLWHVKECMLFPFHAPQADGGGLCMMLWQRGMCLMQLLDFLFILAAGP